APMLAYRVAAPGWSIVAAYYTSLIVAWMLWRRRAITGTSESRRTKWIRACAVVIAVSAAVWILAEPWTLIASRGDGRLHVTFIDVGQGDAALVRFPRGSSLLVDAGGLAATTTFDIGDRVVAPVLRDAGIRRLTALALTHGD